MAKVALSFSSGMTLGPTLHLTSWRAWLSFRHFSAEARNHALELPASLALRYVRLDRDRGVIQTVCCHVYALAALARMYKCMPVLACSHKLLPIGYDTYREPISPVQCMPAGVGLLWLGRDFTLQLGHPDDDEHQGGCTDMIP